MTLNSFVEETGATSISAKSLDENFAKLKPLAQDGVPRQYALTETANGWSLTIFPPFPSTGDLHVLGIQNGIMQWVATEACP
jgi:hypothetical protein